MQYTSKSQQQWQQTGSLQIIFTFTGCAVDLLFLNAESIDRLTVSANNPSLGCFSQRWVSIIYIVWWKTLTKAMTTNLSLLCFFPRCLWKRLALPSFTDILECGIGQDLLQSLLTQVKSCACSGIKGPTECINPASGPKPKLCHRLV